MKLEELSMLLKDTAEMIDSFVKTADTKSGEECCKAYIEENNLEYIHSEVEAAFREGFRTALRQERTGRFEKM